MIIVTGPDNSGKTTLVRKLVEDMGLSSMEKCKVLPLWENHEAYTNWIVHTLKEATPTSIVDRCYIDELAYGPVMRGNVCFNAIDFYRINQALVKVKPLIILANPGIDRIIETYGERDQYPKIEDNLRVLNNFYKLVNEYPFSVLPHYIFDYRFDGNYSLVKKVVAHYLSKGGKNE